MRPCDPKLADSEPRQNEASLLELADQLDPEDGCLWIYDTDDRVTLGSTERGIKSLKELSLDQKR